ncbi:MAG: hypothetical protein ACRC4M_01955 [Mycoplasma sp.]
MKKNRTPPNTFSRQTEQFTPNVKAFLMELRNDVLKISIEEMVYYFGWNNEKYYQQIVNGYKDKDGIKKYKNPTVNYLFLGLNAAMNTHKIFIDNKDAIDALIKKHIIKY